MAEFFEAETPVLNAKRILAVDDIPDIARLIKVTLERCGYEVETVENGVLALAKIKERTPDLLITDVLMPEMDGLELTAKIRADAAHADLPIILLPGKAADRVLPDVRDFRKRGTTNILTKPFRPPELIALVDSMLSRFQTIDESVKDQQ
ncbi:MAG: response regulator [Armatimonadota bacterium]